MKRFRALFILGIFFCSVVQAQEADMKIKIVIKDIDTSRGGALNFMVFSEEGFPKDHSKAIYSQSVATDSKENSFFVDLPATLDEFAIKVHHDQNSDGKVTKNWTRIFPAEGLAFSNGARIRFGPPSFKSAKLTSDKEIGDVELKLIYP